MYRHPNELPQAVADVVLTSPTVGRGVTWPCSAPTGRAVGCCLNSTLNPRQFHRLPWLPSVPASLARPRPSGWPYWYEEITH